MKESRIITKEDIEIILSKDVSELVKESKGFNYLPWAVAWKEFIKIYPMAIYNIEKREDGVPAFGNMELGYMVYTSVATEPGAEPRKMQLPVMEFGSFKVIKKPSMFDINTSIMRCLTKNLALFGLGVDVYIGDDSPEDVTDDSGLQSYDTVIKGPEIDIKIIDADPLDGPVSEIVDVTEKPEPKKDKIKALPKKTKLEDSFKKAVNSDKEYTEEKKKTILSNTKITDTLKQSFIDGLFRF